MLEIEFSHAVEQAEEDYNKYMLQFKCTTCEYFIIQETTYGIIHRCQYKIDKHMRIPRVFELQKKCKFYKKVL